MNTPYTWGDMMVMIVFLIIAVAALVGPGISRRRRGRHRR